MDRQQAAWLSVLSVVVGLILPCQAGLAQTLEQGPREPHRDRTGQDGAAMVLVPAGSFVMGSGQDEVEQAIKDCHQAFRMEEQKCREGMVVELPRHQVRLDAFYLDRYEVTNRLFNQFVEVTGYQTTAEKAGTAVAMIEGEWWSEVDGASWRHPEAGPSVFETGRADHPVVSVSWYDAEAYCRWASKRLPTEAEFEYAMRAGGQTKYSWGDEGPGARRVANTADESLRRMLPPWPVFTGYDDGYSRTAPVGSFESNPWGLFDLTGNVSEWVNDWAEQTYYQKSPVWNPRGASTGEQKVLRGGSWLYPPALLRVGVRDDGNPKDSRTDIGFRCAQDAPN